MLNWRHHLGRDAFDQDRHSPKDFRCIGPLFWVPARSVVHKSLIRWKVAYREVAFLGEMLFSAKCPFPNSVAATLMQWSIYSTAFVPWYGLKIEQDSSHVERRQCVELIKKEAACAAAMMRFFPDKVTKPPCLPSTFLRVLAAHWPMHVWLKFLPVTLDLRLGFFFKEGVSGM